MQNDSFYYLIPCVITGFVSVIVSLILGYFLFAGNGTPQIKTINLGKIHSAEMMLSMKASNLPKNEAKQWIDIVDNASKSLKSVIQSIAGNSIVIVSPAIIQGSEDITPEVLKALNLPTNIPALSTPKELVLGGMSVEPNQSNKSAEPTSKVLSFLKP